MGGNEVRKKYLEFFEKNGHKIIKPASLVLKDDPTTLFTSAGMQPLVPYLMGKVHPEGKRLVDSQPSFRSQDIEEVGDNRHTTLFEMLGNWSLGDYFKKEQIPWFFEFLTKKINLPKEKLYISVFEGDGLVPEDKESYEIWKNLGIPEDHIFKYGVKKNWWSRAGTPDEMPVGEIGGPSSEVFFEFDSVKHNKKFGEKCHPNCDCGRFLEIGNSVFMQYKKGENGLEKLPKNNVDFGGGLERLTAAANNSPDVFKTDLFWPIVKKIEETSGKKYEDYKSDMRVITDHLKAGCFLAADGVLPGNKLQGYVLRRLLRRATTKAYLMDYNYGDNEDFKSLIEEIVNIYPMYFENVDIENMKKEIINEILKFRKNLERGINKINKLDVNDFDEEFAFNLMQSEGFPFEITQELANKKGIKIDKNKFEKLLTKHQELSRISSLEKFKIK